MRPSLRRIAAWAALAGAFVLVAIQLVPYGPERTPPPITGEPAWDSPATRELAARACFDCHSSETRWPWYSHVAPVSWLIRDHVDEGRATLDFSTWDHPGSDPDEAADEVREGEMPPSYYVALHPEARLTDAERAALAAGLEASLTR